MLLFRRSDLFRNLRARVSGFPSLFPISIRIVIGGNGPVLAKYETDKPDNHQDGPGYDQPVRILQSGESAQRRARR